MKITRGLIIAEPWIDHILEGRKDWEMRSMSTSVRGWFGLIRKGSGQVEGLARLVDCGRALSPSEMIANIDHHCIPESMIRSGSVAKWTIPWKISDVVRLDMPVPYDHRAGAVIWVSLSEDVQEQLGRSIPSSSDLRMRDRRDLPCKETEESRPSTSITGAGGRPSERKSAGLSSLVYLPDPTEEVLGRSNLSGGNIRNNHFYLTDFIDRFPRDTIGGRNRSEAASREISIDWGGPQPVLSDIDASKRMFRRRGWVGQFFEASDAREGDSVIVTISSPYHVRVRLERKP